MVSTVKEAYPNYSSDYPVKEKYDLSKWLETMKKIYIQASYGTEQSVVLSEVTKDWNEIEKEDFISWMKYYQGGNQLKYKTAQHNYYVSKDLPDYFLPNPKEIPSPIKNINNEIDVLKDNDYLENQKRTREEDRRRIIEDQRRKLIARLNSAEKILTSHHGQIFAGSEFEKLLNSIFELKRQIQLINKINISAQTCVDLIVRQANILNRQGFKDASGFLFKFAQNTPGVFNSQFGELPTGGSQPEGLGSLSNTPPIGALPKENSEDPTSSDSAISEFLDNLEGAGFTNFDNSEADDVSLDDDVSFNFDDIDEVSEGTKASFNNNLLVVEAQAAPPMVNKEENKPQTIKNEQPVKPAQEQNNKLENANHSIDEKIQKQKSDVDKLIDSVFQNITVQDVIDKLESVAQTFRTREISRQLSICDIMLDRLNLSPFFGSLSEASQKAFESNNYILTRLDDVISKLRGAATANSSGFDDTTKTTPEQSQKIRQNLETQDKKEKEAKDLRKKQQTEELLSAVNKPELEVENPAEEVSAEPTSTPAPKANQAPPQAKI